MQSRGTHSNRNRGGEEERMNEWIEKKRVNLKTAERRVQWAGNTEGKETE